MTAGADDDGVELQKSNIIVCWDLPAAARHILHSLWRRSSTYRVCDRRCDDVTEAGYVGEDVENILLKLIQAADYDIERAQLICISG